MKGKSKATKKLKIIVVVCLVLSIAYILYFQYREYESTVTKSNSVTITNVSYDATRELYSGYNKAFKKYWKKKTGQTVNVDVSNGGSGSQANSVISGDEADVVTLALAKDINSIAKEGLISKSWEKKLANNSSPYTSTIVFLVRKGNSKHIKDWDDLIKSGVNIITSNPETSGAARWDFLSAWAYAKQKYGNSESSAKNFVRHFYQNVTVMDSSSRSATTTFVENGQGDVLVTWENEAKLVMKEYPGKYKIITPSISMKAEPSVAVVNKVANKRKTTKVATAYLKYLYSKKAQKIEAENFYRPTNKKVAKEYASEFPKLKLVSINNKMFGGWAKVQKKFFSSGGIFDQIYNDE